MYIYRSVENNTLSFQLFEFEGKHSHEKYKKHICKLMWIVFEKQNTVLKFANTANNSCPEYKDQRQIESNVKTNWNIS